MCVYKKIDLSFLNIFFTYPVRIMNYCEINLYPIDITLHVEDLLR